MKFVVVGAGYVGMANALMLARQHQVVVLDVQADKVACINQRRSPIDDQLAQRWLDEQCLALSATLDPAEAYAGADYVLIATPTDFDAVRGCFDTRSVETVAAAAQRYCPDACLVVKSTVPIGYCRRLRGQLGETARLLFSPEFLREGQALQDCLAPSRIVVGGDPHLARPFAELLLEAAERRDAPVQVCGSDEAEAIKLFANSYLAMRVAFFNELDSFALGRGLDARQLVEGVCADPRIGRHYNNPSFGYGGYCLPKDTRQLLADFAGLPHSLIAAVVEANAERKQWLVEDILRRQPRVVGAYQLAMKQGSANYRESSIVDVLRLLQAQGVEVLVYQPGLGEGELPWTSHCEELAQFKARAELILCNRRDPALADVAEKVYSRDLFGVD